MLSMLNVFRLSGRARRRDFWVQLACIMLMTAGVGYLIDAMMPAEANDGLAYGYAVLPAGVPLAGLYARRLRDRGRSMLWLLPFLAAPFAAEIAAFALRADLSPSRELAQALSFVGMVLTLWGLLELGAMPGMRPKAPAVKPTIGPYELDQRLNPTAPGHAAE